MVGVVLILVHDALIDDQRPLMEALVADRLARVEYSRFVVCVVAHLTDRPVQESLIVFLFRVLVLGRRLLALLGKRLVHKGVLRSNRLICGCVRDHGPLVDRVVLLDVFLVRLLWQRAVRMLHQLLVIFDLILVRELLALAVRELVRLIFQFGFQVFRLDILKLMVLMATVAVKVGILFSVQLPLEHLQ